MQTLSVFILGISVDVYIGFDTLTQTRKSARSQSNDILHDGKPNHNASFNILRYDLRMFSYLFLL